MRRPRRNHSAEFKARVAGEAIRGVKTVAEIARENNLHPVQVSAWKKELEENLSAIFERKGAADERLRETEERCTRPERKVGQLVIEKEFLENKMRGVGARAMRKQLVEAAHPQLSIRRQCALLGVNRNGLEPAAEKTTGEDLRIMRQLDELHLQEPTYGARRMSLVLTRDHGLRADRKRVTQLMRLMGIVPCWPRPRTNLPGRGHKVFPYLLRDVKIERPNQVWCADITYVPMPHGYCYLMAVMDWYSRKVLGWAVSTTMEVQLCLEAYRMAVPLGGCAPEIMNTDQGSQFTSAEWIAEMGRHPGLRISMDGRGRWVDNVFIERLWWSLKYEDIYLRAYGTPRDLERGVAAWFARYNGYRPHSASGGLTPNQCHALPPAKEVA